jgi:arylsulfatase A-like enzyme
MFARPANVTAQAADENPSPRPNLLLISIDTLRADHVSCYGYPKTTTPTIDRVAKEGHRFTRAYAPMPSTLPSHASLFTSLYPRQLSVRRNGELVPREALTMTEILKENGYATAAFVSAETLHPQFHIDQGFDVYNHHGEEGIERPAKATLKNCLAWLADATAEPFFLFVHFFDPHAGYVAPQRFRRAMGAPDKYKPIESEFVKDRAGFTPEEIEETIAAYDAEILYADWAVGELVKHFEERTLLEKTVVVLVSDHGETLGELLDEYGYAFCHGEFIQGHQIHVPVVFRLPEGLQKPRGLSHPEVIGLIDVLPTVLELLEIESPEGMMGRSLVPLLAGETLPATPIFSERRYYENAKFPYLLEDEVSVIDGRWQAIASNGRGNELFDLREDPNLIEQRREESERLLGLIRKWDQRVHPLFGPGRSTQDAETVEKLESLGYVR